MSSPKILICGHFAKGTDQFDGQTIKTRSIYEQLVKKYGENRIGIIDTHSWKKHPLKIFKQCLVASKNSSDIIILPAHKGVKIFVPLFTKLKKKNHFTLHYIVIGGWIFSLTQKNKFLKRNLQQIDHIYLENHKTIQQFNSIGFKNIEYMPNFKNLKKSTYKKEIEESKMRCCIFSRIEKEKGIIDAINVINKYNQSHKNKIFLDIYGKIKNSFEQEFYTSINDNEYIKYKGTVNSDKSVQIIEKYNLLLFPTKYYTEGIPGTIIDAYFAGTPILASKWQNFAEIITEEITGFGYNFNDNDNFYKTLTNIASNKKKIANMSKDCLVASDKYTPKKAMKILFSNLGDK